MAELSIKRALFGYKRRDVEALLSARDAELELRAAEIRVHCGRVHELEARTARLTIKVAERDRALGELREELRLAATTATAAAAESDLGLGLVASLALRVEELHAQARGQATRIRLAGLRDAAHMTQRLQAAVEFNERGGEKAVEVPIRRVAPRVREDEEEAADERDAAAAFAAAGDVEAPAATNGLRSSESGAVLAGPLTVDVGPLADFAQLIRIEDAVKEIDAATDISITRFSGGRATLAMHFREPIELLRELEERSDLEFKIRRADSSQLVLDVAGAGPNA